MKKLILALVMLFSLNGFGENKVARVIISEAGAECSQIERYYIASCIKNRIRHKGFAMGKHRTMLDVINQKNAFESIGHNANWNWKASANPSSVKSSAWQKAWKQANIFSMKNVKAQIGSVFFMTKGVKPPSNYVSKKYWILKKDFSSAHFDFYSITERK
jgi:hypothetical protein